MLILTFLLTLNVKTGWKPGNNVILKHWRIDKNHSNSYTVFKELGSPRLPNPLEIDAIKEKMGLKLMEPPQQLKVNDLAEIKILFAM